MTLKRYDIYWVNLDPTLGAEIQKTRPAVIISPNVMNDNLSTVIVAPLTSTIRSYPTRVDCIVNGKAGQIALDQIRTVDKTRLLNRLGTLSKADQSVVLRVLQSVFAP